MLMEALDLGKPSKMDYVLITVNTWMADVIMVF